MIQVETKYKFGNKVLVMWLGNKIPKQLEVCSMSGNILYFNHSLRYIFSSEQECKEAIERRLK